MGSLESCTYLIKNPIADDMSKQNMQIDNEEYLLGQGLQVTVMQQTNQMSVEEQNILLGHVANNAVILQKRAEMMKIAESKVRNDPCV